MFTKLSIVIPVYNEIATLEKIIAAVKAVELPLTKEIILVDDASQDGTSELIVIVEHVHQFQQETG